MTMTMNRIGTRPSTAGESDADALLNTLYDTLDAVSELNPDLLHSHTCAGRAVVTLAGAARAAAGALGTPPGTPLRTAPGVVVVRDLVAAVSLVQLAASRRGRPLDVQALQQATHRGNTAYGRFLLSAPAAT